MIVIVVGGLGCILLVVFIVVCFVAFLALHCCGLGRRFVGIASV